LKPKTKTETDINGTRGNLTSGWPVFLDLLKVGVSVRVTVLWDLNLVEHIWVVLYLLVLQEEVCSDMDGNINF
jgi:hypothetical protein